MDKIMRKEFKWYVDAGAAQDSKPHTNIVSFGDGYEQVTPSGINNIRKSWQCTKTGYKEDLDEIYDFLIGTRGVEAFYMTFNGERDLYRIADSVIYQHQSANVWRLSFDVRQVLA